MTSRETEVIVRWRTIMASKIPYVRKPPAFSGLMTTDCWVTRHRKQLKFNGLSGMGAGARTDGRSIIMAHGDSFSPKSLRLALSGAVALALIGWAGAARAVCVNTAFSGSGAGAG